jgi:hypothetical protein
MRKTLLTLALVATAMTTAARAQGDPATVGKAALGGPTTRAEAIAAAGARFAQIDTDHDGRANPTEMRAYRAAMRDRMIARGGEVADPRPGDERHGGRGRQMDGAGRGNGSVTRQEYEDRAARRFDRMDADHSRRIQPGTTTPVMPAPTPVA